MSRFCTPLGRAEEAALTHREKWDGTGCPRGMKGEEIPLVGRFCAVCDGFDASMSWATTAWRRALPGPWPLNARV